MKKTVGCFTAEKLEELAKEPNVTVMQPTHDIVYDPWNAKRVSTVVDRIVLMTRGGASDDEIRSADSEFSEFADKYTVMYSKLTDPAFVEDEGHVLVVKKLVALRAMVELGTLETVDAQARAADIALKSLASRVKS
jgi:hypothetical protein